MARSPAVDAALGLAALHAEYAVVQKGVAHGTPADAVAKALGGPDAVVTYQAVGMSSAFYFADDVGVSVEHGQVKRITRGVPQSVKRAVKAKGQMIGPEDVLPDAPDERPAAEPVTVPVPTSVPATAPATRPATKPATGPRAVTPAAVMLAADHPALSELTPLLTRLIGSDEVQALVKKHQLKKAYKGDSGSLTPDDHGYTLMFRGNRIHAIILRASPWPNDKDYANWTTYAHPLPRDLKAADSRRDVRDKLGKPNAADRWGNGTTELSVQFGDNDAAIEEVWVWAAPARP